MAEAWRNFRTFCRFVFCFAQTTEPNQVEDAVVGPVGDPFDFRRGVRWLPALMDDFASHRSGFRRSVAKFRRMPPEKPTEEP